jgi:hypothetical protein
MKTDEELKTIAKDLYAGKIFSDRHLSGPHEISMVFMILAFLDAEHIKKMQDDNIDFIYEYLDQAGPMAVNGKPTFLSARMLNKDETTKMFDYYKKIKDAVDSATAS